MMIFMVWGGAFALYYRVNLIYQMAGAVLFAMAIELAQFFIPGRHPPRISDFVVDAVAACVSIVLIRNVFWLADDLLLVALVGQPSWQRNRPSW